MHTTINPPFSLQCVSGPDTGQSVALSPQTRLTLGRSALNNLPLADPDVAEDHLTMLFDGKRLRFQVSDSQAVILNGYAVSSGELSQDSTLQIGSSQWWLVQNITEAGAHISPPNAGQPTNTARPITDQPNTVRPNTTQPNEAQPNPANPFGTLDFSDQLNRISTLTGVDTLDSDFSLRTIFGRVAERRSDEDVEAAFTVGTRQTTPVVGTIASNWPQPWLFLRFGSGALLVFAGLYVAVTQFSNALLIPGLLFVGSFAVPFGSLIFFWEMNAPQNVSLYQTIKLLFLGGLVSLLISLVFFSNIGFLETILGASSAGIIEESGKLLAVIFLMRNKNQYHWILNGMLFGAAVGTGFAAFESAGYAFVALLESRDLGAATTNIVLRGVLAPFGHVVWTAITAAALWKVKGQRKFEWDMLREPGFVRTFVAVMILHMVWNLPFDIPILPFLPTKTIIIGVIAWVMALGLIQSGLKQIKRAQQAVLQPA